MPSDRIELHPAPRGTSAFDEGVMLGPYRIHELLGEGSGGRVYRAVHTRLDRSVAVKVLRSEHANKHNLVRRFFQEARAANQIRHQNIVEITDLVTEEDGRSYIIMELLRGESLEQVLEREKLVRLDRAMHIMTQVVSAMEAAHAAGIIHRDLKPGNVFLNEPKTRDFVKLLDFGVAKITFLGPPDVEITESGPFQPEQTQVGTLLGTPEYMSPEQTEGHLVDHRADIYSLGVMMYEMLTGTRPFHAPTLHDVLENHRKLRPPRPSTVPHLPHVIPPRLETLVLRCIEKDPSKRPQTMKEIGAELALVNEELRDRPKQGASSLLLLFALLLSFSLSTLWVILRDRPSTVRLTFDSSPAGARIVRAATKEVLGLTPLTIELPRTSEPELFQVRKSGFEPYEHLVTLSSDEELTAELAPDSPKH